MIDLRTGIRPRRGHRFRNLQGQLSILHGGSRARGRSTEKRTPMFQCLPSLLHCPRHSAPAHLAIHRLSRLPRCRQLPFQRRHAALRRQEMLHLLRRLADLCSHVVAQAGDVDVAGLQLRLHGRGGNARAGQGAVDDCGELARSEGAHVEAHVPQLVC